MIVAQGADLAAFNRKLIPAATAKVTTKIFAEKSGFVSKCDARIIGEVIRDMGGGRFTKDSTINYDVGVDRLAKPGERVEKSGVLCRIHVADYEQARVAETRLKSAFEISPKRPMQIPLVVEIISH
jgi:thymidine phosphorylase